MAIDINDEFKKASEKSKVFKKYKEYKEDYEDLKKKAGDSQEEANKKISQSLDKFTQWRKKHTTEGKTLIDQLIKQLKEIKGSGIETNTLIKRIFVNSLKKIKPDIKKIIIEEAKKALACSNLQKFQFNKQLLKSKKIELRNLEREQKALKKRIILEYSIMDYGSKMFEFTL